MQVPEKLSLIGGSILLVSTLVFTLKSQAATIIPNVGHSISTIYEHIGDAEYGEFENGYRQAQQNHWQTGTWGTSKYYIDDDMNMYVSSGDLQGPLDEITNGTSDHIKSLDFTGKVNTPPDSGSLFQATAWADNHSLTTINGLNQVDTQESTDMSGMFAGDAAIKSLDLSSWNTSSVENLNATFSNLHALTDLNVTDWDVSKVGYMGATFSGSSSLSYLDLSHWNVHAPFIDLPSQLKSDSSHPGTWIRK